MWRIFLVDEFSEETNYRREFCRETLESKGFWLSRSKMKYLAHKFNQKRVSNVSEVQIRGFMIPLHGLDILDPSCKVMWR